MIGAARVSGSELRDLGHLCFARGENADRGSQAERWLASSLPRSPSLSQALAESIGAPGTLFPVATAQGSLRKKSDVRFRAFDGKSAWMVGVSCKLRTMGVGGPAWGNQVARHALSRCVEMGWLPPSDDPAGLAAAKWLTESELPMISSDIDALSVHLRARWRSLVLKAMGFGGKGSFAFALMIAKRNGKYCEIETVGLLGATWMEQILNESSELRFDEGTQTFVAPLVCFQRKGGDKGGKGADDLQVKLNVEALVDRLPTS